MEGPVSTSPLQPPHRTMRRRQLSHARSSWSSGDTPAGPVVVGRSRKAIVPLMAPWEHAIHRWLLIISSDTSCIQLSLWMNGVAQCLFHHIPICDHVFTTQSNTMKFRGERKDPAMTHSLVLWLNETGDRRSYNLVEHLHKHTAIHPCEDNDDSF